MNMSNETNLSKLPGLNRGFSLVELMVALVITLILLAGIGQIFLSSKKSFTIQDSLGRMQENGRYAMETLTQDVRRAGFWGGNPDITTI
jgi:type IV pilus assembly protein PilW